MSTRRRIVRRPAVVPVGDWPAHWPELLRRVHAARGSDARSALPRLADLPPPSGLRGIDAAVALLRDAIASDAHILVVGDFDCDGATACAVGVRGLRLLGARRVSHAVPNRIVHGYGLTPGLVDELAALRPDLVVTVDHGIACHAGIAAAKARGWQVLVTDHHLPGPALPPADAIVNPNQPGCGFPGKALAGVGVVFYLLLALRAALESKADLAVLLDLVAVGTVADLVPLDACNRALVGAGLRRLRAGQGCAGLRALIEVAGRRAEALTTADIGFALGPRINAAGGWRTWASASTACSPTTRYMRGGWPRPCMRSTRSAARCRPTCRTWPRRGWTGSTPRMPPACSIPTGIRAWSGWWPPR